MIEIDRTIALREDELEFRFIRASGPGGQNINKVATAVQLRFDVDRSPSLPAHVKRRLRDLAGRRLTNNGILIIDARRFRTQDRNREDAVKRLIDIIRDANNLRKPRIATHPTLASKRQRLDTKRRVGTRKRLRRRPDLE